jgi:hypothetical protein
LALRLAECVLDRRPADACKRSDVIDGEGAAPVFHVLGCNDGEHGGFGQGEPRRDLRRQAAGRGPPAAALY